MIPTYALMRRKKPAVNPSDPMQMLLQPQQDNGQGTGNAAQDLALANADPVTSGAQDAITAKKKKQNLGGMLASIRSNMFGQV